MPPSHIFHLAIPCKDLDEARAFYNGKLGCEIGRAYEDRVTFDFFGLQLVCHLNPEAIDPEPCMYPRHFGITFVDSGPFEEVLHLARSRGVPFFKEPFRRFEGAAEEHTTFFLMDPSNNLIEFKHYRDSQMMY